MKGSVIRFSVLVNFNILIYFTYSLIGQDSTNSFLNGFQLKAAIIPPYESASKPTDTPIATITLSDDTLGKISRYYFGYAIAVWMGDVTDDSVFVNNVRTLAPTLIHLFWLM